MKYKVRLRDKFYEVEVVEGEAVLLDYYEASTPIAAPVATETPAAAPVAAPVSSGDGNAVTAPLPGSVIEVKVNVGDTVKKGQILVLIEAMKMENEIVAPADGVVKAVHTTKGSTVATGTPLVTIG